MCTFLGISFTLLPNPASLAYLLSTDKRKLIQKLDTICDMSEQVAGCLTGYRKSLPPWAYLCFPTNWWTMRFLH